MKFLASALALSAALAGTALANSEQLARNAGLTPAEAATLSLSELAALKFNRGSGQDDHQPILRTASENRVVKAGRSQTLPYPQLAATVGLRPEEAVGLGLSELAALKFNREAGADGQQSVRPFMPAVSSTVVWQPGDDD